MTVKGMATCAHCRALISTPICPICGKSVHDPVEAPPPGPVTRTLAREDRRRLIGFGVGIVVIATAGIGARVLLSRAPAEPQPTVLAAPTETTTTVRTEGDAPTVTRPDGPVPTLPSFSGEGAERAVGPNPSPWRGDAPVDVVTGDLLADADHSAGVAAVAAMLAGIPEGWTLAPTTATEVQGVPLAAVEASQGFAARTVSDDFGLIGDVWVIARGPRRDDASAHYFDQAVGRWGAANAIDTFAPEPGVRIHLVAADGIDAVWVDQRADALLVFTVPSTTDLSRLTDLVDAWR